MSAHRIKFSSLAAESLDSWSLYTSASWCEAFVDPDRLSTELIVTEHDNPRAAVVVHEMPQGWANTVYDNFTLAGAVLGGQRSDWLPQTLLGARVGQRNTISVRDNLSAKEQAVALRDTLSEVETGPGSIGYLYLSAPDAERIMAASGGEYLPLLTEAGSVLTVPEGGFDGYLASLKSSHRSVVRRDISRYTGSLETRIVREDDEQIDAYGALLANVQSHHDQPSSAEAMASYVRRCVRSGNPVIAFEARAAGSLRGVGIGIEYRGVLWMRIVGLQYDDNNGTDGAYPQVLIYGPLRYAMERGLGSIDLGAGVSDAKHLRGAKKIPLWSVFRPPRSIAPIDPESLRSSNITRAAELGLDLDDYPGDGLTRL